VLGGYGALGGIALGRVAGIETAAAALAVALACAVTLAGAWSWLIGRTVVGPLHRQHRLGQPVLVATAAAALSIEELLRVSQGVSDRWLPQTFHWPLGLVRAEHFIVTVTPMQIACAAAAFVCCAVVLWTLRRTPLGREWRAFSDDPQAAALLGVSPDRLLAVTFLAAGLLAGLAGWIVAAHYGNVSHAMAPIVNLKAIVAAIIGGIGSVPGAFAGGVLIGILEASWSAFFTIEWRDLAVFSVLVVVFVLRPEGLFAGILERRAP
jgi:branched-chain amino acid transport system permease protein